MIFIIILLLFIKSSTSQMINNYCRLYQDFYYKPNKCNYQVMKTNFSQIYCPETSCLYASGYIQVSRFKIFEGKFYGCPSYLRYIGAVLNLDKEIFDSSIKKCEDINSCVEINYKLPTVPSETTIDMTICCNNDDEKNFYDTPPVVIEQCNLNCSNKEDGQIILPVGDCLSNVNGIVKVHNFTLIILIFLSLSLLCI